jgi:phosphatidylserine decarboxylase
VWNRDLGVLEREPVMAESGLRWLYGESRLGRFARSFLRQRPVSALYGLWQNRRIRTSRLSAFASKLAIDLDEVERPITTYRTMNEFFARRLKPNARPFPLSADTLASPADARVLAFENLDGERLPVKGGAYTLGRLLDDDALATRYRGGTVIVLRLAPPDYHRFHMPCDAVASSARRVHGRFDSVNPIALERAPDLFCRNERMITMLDTERFGSVAFIEVGATMVGKIVQTFRPGRVTGGQEKGYFLFGASTVVLVLEAGRLRLTQDLAAHGPRGLETRLRCGDPLGVRAS